jgi:small subunit ribosomal protein S1
VFVDLGGIDGLVHKSELSWNKVNNPETAYEIGEQVEAEVIDINHERGRISLSIRRLQPDPWQESVAKYTIGDLIDGTVTKLVNFGAFVRIEEGLEGLIHISELSNSRVAHPGDVVQEGQQLKLKIISLDSERHRLGLSLKQTEDRSVPTVQPSYEMTELPGDGEGAAAADRGPRPERTERTERPERTDRARSGRSRDRRDRDYRPEDATAEPAEGIDNTMAAAFAESGLLDQFRTDEPESKSAAADEAPAAEVAAAPAVEAVEAVEAVADEPATAEAPAAEAAEVAEAAEKPAAPAKARKKSTKAAAEKPAAEKPAAEEPAAEAVADEASGSSEPDKG